MPRPRVGDVVFQGKSRIGAGPPGLAPTYRPRSATSMYRQEVESGSFQGLSPASWLVPSLD